MSRYIHRGDRVVYVGAVPSLTGKAGRLSRPMGENGANHPIGAVIFDHDGRERVVEMRNLSHEGVNPMKNIKSAVGDAVRALLKPLDADSAKEQAGRRLGVASELVRLGEADKKKAKTELTTLGVITGGEQNGIVFDSPRYVVTATTKAASSRIEAGALTAALRNEYLSEAMQRRIIAAATVSNKAATSFTVESK